MKILGILLFIAGLLLVPQFIAPAHSPDTNPSAHFGFVVLSNEGVITGIVLMLVGVLIVRRALGRKSQPR